MIIYSVDGEAVIRTDFRADISDTAEHFCFSHEEGYSSCWKKYLCYASATEQVEYYKELIFIRWEDDRCAPFNVVTDFIGTWRST